MLRLIISVDITKTRPCNIQRFFSTVKMKKKMLNILNMFRISAQNIAGGYPHISRKSGMYEGMHFIDILPSCYVQYSTVRNECSVLLLYE